MSITISNGDLIEVTKQKKLESIEEVPESIMLMVRLRISLRN